MTDDEVLAALRALNYVPIAPPENGSILCQGHDSTFYVLDPRELPNFDGMITAELIIRWGGF